tara:strand:- start:292 stop:969 length:678 start_codon:yes stop_codon:yes gene_type:complete
MKIFGIETNIIDENTFLMNAGMNYKSPGEINVESDASSASYFLAAGAITGGPVRVEGLGKFSIQGDIFFTEILKKMGAKITISENWIESSSQKILQPIDYDFNNMPDVAMTAAIVSLFANGTSFIRNIGSWRVKETDRLSAMSKELSKLGVKVYEGKDFLKLTPPKNFIPAEIDTYDDHRIAMCFSLVSLNSKLRNGTDIRINNPQCVSKTFPRYFEYFKKLLIN